MKLWVDDERDPPDTNWVVARKPGEAIRLIASPHRKFEEISLDHDDGGESFESVAYLIGEKYWTNKPADGFIEMWEQHRAPKGLSIAMPRWHPKITIHSANPIGAKTMVTILRDYGIVADVVPYSRK